MKNLWNKIPKWVSRPLIVIALIVTVWSIVYPWGSVRYKVTVEIETPEGLKTGSAVREVSILNGPRWTPESGPHVEQRGEAVVIDLGKRGVAFAVMGTDDYQTLYRTFSPPSDYKPFMGFSDYGLGYYRSLKNKTSLPLNLRPLIVTFQDPKDPKTVVAVYSPSEDNFEKLF